MKTLRNKTTIRGTKKLTQVSSVDKGEGQDELKNPVKGAITKTIGFSEKADETIKINKSRVESRH